jgi:serine/threonine protein kinase
MELVKGEPLHEYLYRKGTLTENQARNIVIQLLDAGAYMHAFNVFHRDLKLENIMINDLDQKVTVIDYGYCCHQKITQLKQGTESYYAPELFTSGPYDGAACDVFALGVVVIELLLGCC